MFDERPPRRGCFSRLFGCGCSVMISLLVLGIGLGATALQVYMSTEARRPDPPRIEKPAPSRPHRRR